jgi:hypothetical protein
MKNMFHKREYSGPTTCQNLANIASLPAGFIEDPSISVLLSGEKFSV